MPTAPPRLRVMLNRPEAEPAFSASMPAVVGSMSRTKAWRWLIMDCMISLNLGSGTAFQRSSTISVMKSTRRFGSIQDAAAIQDVACVVHRHDAGIGENERHAAVVRRP